MLNLLASYGYDYENADETALNIILGVYGTIIIILLIAGLVIACITAIIAHSKGRSVVGWFCLSFFILGVIALIIILCLPSLNYNNISSNGNFWTCSCGQGNNGQFCSRCGKQRVASSQHSSDGKKRSKL